MSQALDVVSPSLETVTRESLAGFVLAEILRTSGPQPPCYRAQEILEAFWDRFGPDKAVRVLAVVFGRCRGFWRGAPVTPLRFQEGQDEFFALPVLESGDDGE